MFSSMESVGLILSQKKKEGQDLSKSPGKYEKENMIYTIKKVIAFVWLLIYLESVMKLWGRFDGFVKISVSRKQILMYSGGRHCPAAFFRGRFVSYLSVTRVSYLLVICQLPPFFHVFSCCFARNPDNNKNAVNPGVYGTFNAFTLYGIRTCQP